MARGAAGTAGDPLVRATRAAGAPQRAPRRLRALAVQGVTSGRSSVRVVVVGAGHNGLVCAAHLARAGFAVSVLEQAEHPGGAVCSHGDTLPGFVHDRCAGFFPLTLASPAFDALDVRERLAWANPDVAMAYPFDDGNAICLHRDLDETVASLESTAAGAGRRWQETVEPLLARRTAALAWLRSSPPRRPGRPQGTTSERVDRTRADPCFAL